MLPYAVKLTRLLHMRQNVLGRRFSSFEVNRSKVNTRVSYRIYDLALLHTSSGRRGEIFPLSSPKQLGWIRKFANSSNSESSSKGNGAAIKTRTKKKTAPESKKNIDTPISNAVNVTIAPKVETKTVELETTKGLLSITATIEDSKINDIVFEKAKQVDADIAVPPSTLHVKEIIKEVEHKDKQQQKEQEKELIQEQAKQQSKLTIVQKSTKTVETNIPTTTTDATKKIVTPLAAAMKSATKAAASVAQAIKSSPTSSTPAPKAKKRTPVDFNRSSLERNFITPARANVDFLLNASDLESLAKIKRRSPYEQEPPITVYWRRDVEAKAYEVWGSKENLLKEQLKREIERKTHQQNIFTVKRRLRDYRREVGSRTGCINQEPGLEGKSGKVVLIAIAINGVNFLFKACGWLCTGSHSMFAETVHSLADTINQLILAYGIQKSTQMADKTHPYGYANMRYVSSLISGVGIFCVGAGLSVYHGITGLMHPEPTTDFFWAFFILGGSLVSEGATLLVAANEVNRAAKCHGLTFAEYVWNGKDPCVNVVLTEDAAAVASVVVAASCMGLTTLTGLHFFDALGSLLVGGILGAVASFIIYTNAAALVGKSISQDLLNRINTELESDVMIRAIHDVKGIDMGNTLIRYKAEMDFDGRELTRLYLEKQDLNELLKIVKSFQNVEELEEFLLKHGENIVDLMGGEIDRIEMKLRKKFPEIRHCDLEIL